uniref:Hesp-642 n=1 Tax=Melampsora lini TaxID=5261 RepID=Q2MV35_MELLI|nr:hesp-642 [Melampsora lini]
MHTLLISIVTFGALFLFASSQDFPLHTCRPPLLGAPAQVTPEQCRLALKKISKNRGFLAFNSTTNYTQDCGGCKVELFSIEPLGGGVEMNAPIPMNTVKNSFKYILAHCKGGIGTAFIGALDKNVTTAKILIDSSNSTEC